MNLHPLIFLPAKREVVVQVLSAPDPKNEGRQRFVASWLDGYLTNVRGQFFNAHLAEHLRLWAERKRKVNLIPLTSPD
jgi:hypothetical protein